MSYDDVAVSVRDNKHIPVLDGLRGFAVLFVILYHYFPDYRNYSSELSLKIFSDFPFNILQDFASFGFSGVDLFFVLSGFLITGTLVKSREHENYFRNFYLRRFLRIFPLYYFLLTIFILIIPHNYFGTPEGNYYPYWFFIMNFLSWFNVASLPLLSVTWSLAIEEQYYLVIPSIVYIFDKRRLLILLVAVFIFSFLARTLLFRFSVFDATTLYKFTFTRLDGISLGGIIRLLFEFDEKYKRMIILFVKGFTLIAVVNIVLVVFCELYPDSSGDLRYHPLMITIGFATISIMYASLLMHCVHKNNIISFLLSTKFLRITGRYSYAMYLFHLIGLSLSNVILSKIYFFTSAAFFKHHSLTVVFGLLLTYFMAIISWNLLESPCLKLKRKFT